MDTRSYHHGNLKQEFIERGLDHIAKNGVRDLSMRKLSTLCGVSSAAPYAHFANKEEFLSEVQKYITDLFCETLRGICEDCPDKAQLLIKLGVGYVMFFYSNPAYLSFLFTHGSIDIGSYPPFLIFREAASDVLKGKYGSGLDEKEQGHKITAMWSMVHGLAQIYTFTGYPDKRTLSEDMLAEEISEVLRSVDI